VKAVIWVCGGVNYERSGKIRRALARFEPGSVVVTGQASGADSIADFMAVELKMFRVRVPYAGHLGRAGGPARNELIGKIVVALAAEKGWPKYCLAFGGDSGTDGSIAIAERLDINVRPYDRKKESRCQSRWISPLGCSSPGFRTN
jgi:hypothetical protein